MGDGGDGWGKGVDGGSRAMLVSAVQASVYMVSSCYFCIIEERKRGGRKGGDGVQACNEKVICSQSKRLLAAERKPIFVSIFGAPNSFPPIWDYPSITSGKKRCVHCMRSL